MKEQLLKNIDKIHTTELGDARIRRNLAINEDVVSYCVLKILKDDSKVIKKR